MKKMMKKLLCGVLAITGVVGCAGTLTACETSHPEVEMQIEFNGETYTLAYKLYRKIAPSTVNHFLWLAENGYYDGLCVHDLTTGANERMYTGAYSAATDENDKDGLVYKSYYDVIKGFASYADFPATVWMNEDKTTPTYTLYGEFENNGFTVTNGDLKETFGSLTMYYNEKDTEDKVYAAYLKEDKKGEAARRYYKYNSATSMFYISLSTGESNNRDYCTFATLDEDSVEVLEEFQAALDEYIADTYGEEAEIADFTTQQTVTVDEDDAYVGTQRETESFLVPNQPIVIKKVTVTKY